jgi:hypothetical protein
MAPVTGERGVKMQTFARMLELLDDEILRQCFKKALFERSEIICSDPTFAFSRI